MQTGAYENLTIKYYSAIILKQYISIKRYVDISPAYFFSSESVFDELPSVSDEVSLRT